MKLIFVYNAESGKLSALLDLGHKIVSPESYKCNLCNLTHGTFRERGDWKRFKDSTSVDLVFLHKDEFEREYGKTYTYPIVLRSSDGLDVLISTEELRSLTTTAQLVELVRSRSA